MSSAGCAAPIGSKSKELPEGIFIEDKLAGGGNWDYIQDLVDQGNGAFAVNWPKGPLVGIRGHENPDYVEAWVVQRTSGASQRSFQRVFASRDAWMADQQSGGWRRGSFTAGPALGIALLSVRDDRDPTKFSHYWWTDEIFLRVRA